MMEQNNQQPTQPQAGFVMMPPPWMQQSQQQHITDSSVIQNVAPVRVTTAIDFVAMMQFMTKPIVAIDNLGNMQVEQPQLVTEQGKNAYDAACVMLADYFNGELSANQLENSRNLGNSFELTKRCPGQPTPCPVCRDKEIIKKRCSTCRGTGGIIMVPQLFKDDGEIVTE